MAFDPVSLTALVIAVIALIPAVLQALQSYVATAEGHRRCQAPVMGAWSKFTKRRFRVRELRFETLYDVPLITFELSGLFQQDGTLFGTDNSQNRASERVSWLSLLEGLKEHSLDFAERGTATWVMMLPKIERLTRSWDFVPPDVVRPLALSDVCSIVIAAMRLGLQWREIDPVKGVFIAEGNSQAITSSTVQGVGTVIQYYGKRPRDYRARLRVQLTGAYYFGDYLTAGYLSSSWGFTTRGLTSVGSPGDKIRVMQSLLSSLGADAVSSTIPILHKEQESGNTRWLGLINDLIPFRMPQLRVTGPCIAAFPNATVEGLTDPAHYGTFVSLAKAWIDQRSSHISVQRERLLKLFEQVDRWVGECLAIHPKGLLDWENMHAGRRKELAQCHEILAETDIYLNKVEERARSDTHQYEQSDQLFRRIKAAHIRIVFDGYDDSYKPEDIMKRLFERLDDDICGQATRDISGYTDVRQAAADCWLTMMFRAFLWQMIHFKFDSNPVPLEWLESRIPVFIG